jgi:hypothetical protein
MTQPSCTTQPYFMMLDDNWAGDRPPALCGGCCRQVGMGALRPNVTIRTEMGPCVILVAS